MWQMTIDSIAACDNPVYGHAESSDTRPLTGRQMPLAPEMFAWQLAGRKFTSRGDKNTVVRLYTETSLGMLRGLTRMDLDGAKIGPGGARRLAASVYFCQSLETLSLNGMGMTAADAAELAPALPQCQVRGGWEVQQRPLATHSWSQTSTRAQFR